MSIPFLFASGCILLVMMVFEVPLDISTSAIGVTAIAASVDFSIYFMAEYKRYALRGHSHKKALRCAYEKEGKVVWADCILNQIFFLPLIVSSFLPVQRLGWMVVAMLFFAAVGALIVMPCLLKWTGLCEE